MLFWLLDTPVSPSALVNMLGIAKFGPQLRRAKNLYSFRRIGERKNRMSASDVVTIDRGHWTPAKMSNGFKAPDLASGWHPGRDDAFDICGLSALSKTKAPLPWEHVWY